MTDRLLHRAATGAMGTRFEFVLIGEHEHHLRAVADELVDEVQLWHRRLNYFAPDSIITRLNRHAAREPVTIDRETFTLLERCRDLGRLTEGAFDVGIAGHLKRLGFRGPADGLPRRMARFTESVELDANTRTVRFLDPNVEIDVGGIGKGFALDQLKTILVESGIEAALIHGGTSSVLAFGAPPDQPTWRIRIAGPADGTVALRDEALSVSAPHGRAIGHENETIGHIIDPRTGEPVPDAIIAAAICDSATDADAWATALVVLGERPSCLSESTRTIITQLPDQLRCAGSGAMRHDLVRP